MDTITLKIGLQKQPRMPEDKYSIPNSTLFNKPVKNNIKP